MRVLFQAPGALLVSGSIALLAFAGPLELAGPLITIWGLGCAASLLRARNKTDDRARNFSRSAGVAVGLLTTGTAIREAHGLLIGEDAPLTSPADIVHIPAYLCTLWVAWVLYRSRIARRNPDAWLDAASIVLAILLVLWTTTLGDFLFDSGLSAGEAALNSFYNAAALTALLIVLRITATPGWRPRAYYLIGTGFFAGFIADIAISVSLALDGDLRPSIALGPIAVGLVTAGINDPTSNKLTEQHSESEERVTAWRYVIVSLAAFGPVCLLFVSDDAVVRAVAVVMALTLALTLNVRIICLLKRQQRSVEMERQLASEIAALSQLEEPREIQRRIGPAIDRIVGPGIVEVQIDPNQADEEIDVAQDVSFSVSEVHQGGPEVSRLAEMLIREADLLASAASAAAQHKRELLEVELERGVMQSERRHHALSQNAADAVFILDHRDGAVMYASPSVEGMSGWRPDEYVGRTLEWCVHPNDTKEGVHAFARVVATRAPHHLELRVMTKEGDPLLMQCVFTDMRDVGEVEGVVVNVTDITDRRLLESSLRDAELFDPLTLLFNRNAFIREVSSAVRSSTFNQAGVVVSVINIDEFRVLNEGLGSEIGDEVLIETAARIRRQLRMGDMVARLSGDEFGVLMSVENSPDQIVEPVERILAAIAEPLAIQGHGITLQATAGLAIDTDGSTSGMQLITNADTALDAAKDGQRGGVVIFDDAMGEEMSRRMRIRNRLGNAIEDGELRLVYQPISDMTTGEIVSLEALARWTDPELGAVTPNVFIAVAERTGMIMALGDWALRTACSQIIAWDKMGYTGFSVSVNMSADQLRSPTVVQQISGVLDEFAISPDRLTIEITESMLLDDTDLVSGRIQDIRALGVQLSIDDFGTGYSSLSYLRKYEFDVLKIDRGFVVPLGDSDNHRDRQIVKNMITLAQDLDAVTVAEGIESHAEFDSLVALGCDRAQGYLLWKPLEVDDATNVLMMQQSASRAA